MFQQYIQVVQKSVSYVIDFFKRIYNYIREVLTTKDYDSYDNDLDNYISNDCDDDYLCEDCSVQDMVIHDMIERRNKGLDNYGVLLYANGGNMSLQDAYEEALDLCFYLRQKIEEEKVKTSEN